MPVTDVTFFADGLKLSGTLRLPAGLPSGVRPPVVVCLQGFSLTRTVWLPAFAERFVEAGYATFHLDYRGFGDSEGEPRCRLQPLRQADDVRAALSALETLPEVDASRVALFGISLGGSVALQVAGTDARVKAVISVAAPADLHRVWSAFPEFPRFQEKVHAARRRYASTGEATWVAVPKVLASDPGTCALLLAEHPKHPRWRLEITFESLADLFEFRPEQVVPGIRGASLFLHPQLDTLIAQTEVHSAFAAAPEPKELVVLEGLRHQEVYAGGPGFEPVTAHTLDFLRRRLPAAQTPGHQ